MPIGLYPDDIAINPGVNKVYVATTDTTTNSANIVIIDCTNNMKTNTITLPNTHPQITIDNKTNTIYVSNLGSNTISIIDSNNLNNIKNVKMGPSPFDLAVNPNTDMVYVTNKGSNTVSVIDGKTKSVVGNVTVG